MLAINTYLLITWLLLILNISNIYSQNKIIFDEAANQNILFGNCNFEAFNINPFNEWYDEEYFTYEVNKSQFDFKESLISDVSIIIVLGSWCGDSKREVPRFIKILNELGSSPATIEIIGVNRNKEAENIKSEIVKSISLNELDIKYVPTFIFYKNKKEIGRIIETPIISLELDMLNILSSIIE